MAGAGKRKYFRRPTPGFSRRIVKIGGSAYDNPVRRFRILLSAALLLLIPGCKNTYEQTITEPPPEAAPLRPGARVYIGMPDDALDKKETVPNSGRRTTLALQEAFQRQTKGVVVARTPETLEESLDHARSLNCQYVVFPTINKWQDRPTEWTAVPDRLDLRIDLVAVDTGEVIRSTNIKGKSRLMTDGSDAPQDLLADPVDKFARALFRRTYQPSALQK